MLCISNFCTRCTCIIPLCLRESFFTAAGKSRGISNSCVSLRPGVSRICSERKSFDYVSWICRSKQRHLRCVVMKVFFQFWRFVFVLKWVKVHMPPHDVHNTFIARVLSACGLTFSAYTARLSKQWLRPLPLRKRSICGWHATQLGTHSWVIELVASIFNINLFRCKCSV